jgi:tetratricopeptide (TPR) repeat protein
VIEIDPSNLEAWNNKGSSLTSARNYESAIRSYETVIKLDSNNEQALEQLGSLYADYVYNFPKALEQSKKLVLLKDDAPSRLNLVEDLIKTGMFQESRKYANDVLIRLAPTSDNIRKVITKFMILCSYVLEQDVIRADKELISFTDYVGNASKDLSVQEERWVFNGLKYVIFDSKISYQSKFLLFTLIDLLGGKLVKANLSALSYNSNQK